MRIENIKLVHFRNYQEQKLELDSKINLFYGDNAQGKTNILEAVFLCAIGKSFRARKEKELIQLGQESTKVEIEYQKEDRKGKIGIEIGEKKEVFINGIKQKKLSDLLGKLNVVMFSPEDIEILKNGPNQRRKFLTIMISQLRPQYVYSLNSYLKTLEQRNNYLKQMKFEKQQNEIMEIWEQKLAEYAIDVVKYRKEYIEKIKEKIQWIHPILTENKEKIEIFYQTDVQSKEQYQKELEKTRKIDLIKGYTTKGIHRDDFSILINGSPVNVYGSQGQNRTVILTLKLAELELMKEEIGESPILLLDDFMSELDPKRRNNFIKSVKDTQVLITCTELFTIEDQMCKTFHIKQGNVENQ